MILCAYQVLLYVGIQQQSYAYHIIRVSRLNFTFYFIFIHMIRTRSITAVKFFRSFVLSPRVFFAPFFLWLYGDHTVIGDLYHPLETLRHHTHEYYCCICTLLPLCYRVALYTALHRVCVVRRSPLLG